MEDRTTLKGQCQVHCDHREGSAKVNVANVLTANLHNKKRRVVALGSPADGVVHVRIVARKGDARIVHRPMVERSR